VDPTGAVRRNSVLVPDDVVRLLQLLGLGANELLHQRQASLRLDEARKALARKYADRLAGHRLQAGKSLFRAARHAAQQLLAQLHRGRALLIGRHGRDLLDIHPHLQLRRIPWCVRRKPLAKEVHATLVPHDLQQRCLPVSRPQ